MILTTDSLRKRTAGRYTATETLPPLVAMRVRRMGKIACICLCREETVSAQSLITPASEVRMSTKTVQYPTKKMIWDVPFSEKELLNFPKIPHSMETEQMTQKAGSNPESLSNTIPASAESALP